MQLRVITLPWDAESQSFSEAKLLEATNSKDVLDYEARWTSVDGRECLVLTLKLTGAGTGNLRNHGPAAYANTNTNDAKRAAAMEFIRKLEEQMPEPTKAVFYKLKEWRAEKAKAAGVPVFSVANNRQLAEVAFRAPKSLAQIKEIKGLAGAFVKNYGEEVLAFVRNLEPVAYKLPEQEEKPDEKDEKGSVKDDEGAGRAEKEK